MNGACGYTSTVSAMVYKTTLVPTVSEAASPNIAHVACQVQRSALCLKSIQSLAVISLFRTHPLPGPEQGRVG